VIRYLARVLRAQLRHAKGLYLLTVAGVALGVAAVLAIQILNRSAIAAFRGSLRAVSGEADLTIVGRTPTFPESLYVRVLAQNGVAGAWPLFRVKAAVAAAQREESGRTARSLLLEIVGADLFQPVGFPVSGAAADRSVALAARGWVAVTPELARERGWRVGDTIEAASGTRRTPLVLGALAEFRRVAPLAARTLAVMDIAQAQALFGERGRISQIDVKLTPSADPNAVGSALRRALGESVDVLLPEQRERRATDLMGAFRVNLTALSMISLFVGLFLVYASTQASLVRRRVEFGVLRSLGATRWQLLGLITAEVALLGAVGVAVGIPLGYAVAAANVDAVSATITNLYLLEAIERLVLPPGLALAAALIGVGGALAGALFPAIDTSRRDPKALLSAYTLHERVGSLATPLAAAGTLVLAGAALWYALLGRGWRPAGFVLAVSLLLALPFLTPAAVRLLATPVAIRGFGLGYSVRTLAVRLHATSTAVAALAVAVSMLTGITVMVGSFRRTVELWVAETVAADVYITTPAWSRSQAASPLDSALVADLARLPPVRAVDRLRGLRSHVGGQPVAVAGIETSAALPPTRFRLMAGDPEEAWRRVRDEGEALVSEPLARKRKVGVGDTVRLAGPQGTVSLAVAGVYYDYSTEAGAVAMRLATLERHFGPGAVNSVALYLEPGANPEELVGRLHERYTGVPLLVRSNRTLRQEVMRIFDQTFAITRVLQGMSLLIAAAGITLTLLVIARERLSELALYRALGAARPQIFGVFLGKGVTMGLLGIALGAAGGLGLAAVLIFVINRSYFGWTIQVHLPWRALGEQTATIVAATLAASAYPALRAAHTPAAELSRDDV
jgi:putative ABC transport system permease protein